MEKILSSIYEITAIAVTQSLPSSLKDTRYYDIETILKKNYYFYFLKKT
ncbi:MAG: hypothetical protein HY738_17920 [Bacteroidia bacterium]|nr:hypothetical protein [Bacteroidia bacterium]